MTTRDLLTSLMPPWVDVPGGTVALHDARAKRRWTAEIAAFQLASVPVTRALYQAVAAADGSTSVADVDPRLPVTDVSWHDARRFCDALSQACGLAPVYTSEPGLQDESPGFRLPTEAEWEHACRAGSASPQYGPLDDIAWYERNSDERVRSVATRAANAWGLYDMLGNVWEWTDSLLDAEVYKSYRVFRGGGWADPAWSCRASCRRGSHPTFRIDDLGFRLARSVSGGTVRVVRDAVTACEGQGDAKVDVTTA